MQFSSAVFITSCFLQIFVAGREGWFPNNYSEIRGHQLSAALPFWEVLSYCDRTSPQYFGVLQNIFAILQKMVTPFLPVRKKRTKDLMIGMDATNSSNRNVFLLSWSWWFVCTILSWSNFFVFFLIFPFLISCELFSSNSISFDDHWPLTNLERLKGDQNRFAALNLGSWGENSQVNMRFER